MGSKGEEVSTASRPDWMIRVQAVLFDMDGTLIDSEHLAGQAIDQFLHDHGVQMDLENHWYHGRTWRSIADHLQSQSSALSHLDVATVLETLFREALVHSPPRPIPGATHAVIRAASQTKTAIVSSSDRRSVLHIVDRFGFSDVLDQVITAEDVERSKPDPQCFQLAAQRLGVDAECCVVFEDSVAGVLAANAAGMRTISVGSNDAARRLADLSIKDFQSLGSDFFGRADASVDLKR